MNVIPISHIQLVHHMVRETSTGGFFGVSIHLLHKQMDHQKSLKDIQYLEQVVVYMLETGYLYECLDYLHVETVDDHFFNNKTELATKELAEEAFEDIIYYYMYEGCTIV